MKCSKSWRRALLLQVSVRSQERNFTLAYLELCKSQQKFIFEQVLVMQILSPLTTKSTSGQCDIEQTNPTPSVASPPATVGSFSALAMQIEAAIPGMTASLHLLIILRFATSPRPLC
jgi:hypothetical protein